MFFVCVTVGLVLFASKYHDNVIRSVKNLCHTITSSKSSFINNDNNNNYQINNKNNVVSLDKIILADSPEKCDYAVQRIRCNLADGVLGLDCEWVNDGRVSLLQLATHNGVCALFRLGKIGYIPTKLKELLGNDCILKVGVATYEDGRKLSHDYDCTVLGTVDLRTLADRLNVPSRKSLASLCLQYLGVEMDKMLEVRCGNWDAEVLDNDQIEYAAYDAIASVLIYHQIRREAKQSKSIWKSIAICIKKTWGKKHCSLVHDLPEGIVDTRFRYPAEGKNCNNTPTNNNTIVREPQQNPKKTTTPIKSSSIPTRKEPLYHNCYLQAPDGETLCTCDRKKAEWYISKGLGVKVIDSPFTVKLNFEPSGRALGEVGQYYTQVKLNQCVVCGAQDKFIKKNVVPREYRKYFPLIMKAHQSHDVLLLCPFCHEVSNKSDLELRKKLEIMCDAPLTRSANNAKNEQHQYRRKFMSAVKALRVNSSSIPLHRRQELESRVLEFTGYQNNNVDLHLPQLIEERIANEFNVSSTSCQQTRCPPHGLKVVQYFTQSKGGLVTLERMWREHFLETMKPKYLPKLWSVRHNQERLEIRQIQNRIEPEDAKVAGLIR